MNKTITYNSNDRAIIAALKNAPQGLTLGELKEATGIELAPGHVVATCKKGLAESAGEKTIYRDGTREVLTYVFTTADALSGEKGTYNYTEGEMKILAAASKFNEPFTLAELAEALGVEKLSSGSINGLVRKQNIAKGEMKAVPCKVKSTVKVYSFVKDIPDEA